VEVLLSVAHISATHLLQRGGAWVVLDPSINSEHMEMYADVEARAGVLGWCTLEAWCVY
jgi:acetyl-CoA carboxylase carboxyltransferase component